MSRIFSRPGLLLLAILIGAALLRTMWLGSLPPGIHPDAAANALDAWRAYTTHHHLVFYEANFGREGLFINLVSYSFQLFGPTLVAYKIPGVLVGLCSVLGMYVLGALVGRRRALGLWAAFFTAISFWLIVFERTGLRAVVSVACVIWTTSFFLLALRQRRWYWYALTGLFLGLGLNTYISFRLMPLILLTVFVFHVWAQRKLASVPSWTTWRMNWGVMLTLLMAAVVIWPLARYFLAHPSFFMGRANDVSVFSQPHWWRLLAESTVANLGIFTFFGDPNWRHNISTQPLLDTVQSVLFAAGLCLTWRRARRVASPVTPVAIEDLTTSVLLLVLFGAMIIPAATTYSPGGIPHSLRIIDTAPAVYLFVALGAAAIFERCWVTFAAYRRRIITATAIFVCALTLLTGIEYVRWGLNSQVAHEYSQDFTNISTYINAEANRGQRVYVVTTSSEIEFFTIATHGVQLTTAFDQTMIDSFHPEVVVVTTTGADAQRSITTLRDHGWHDVSSLQLGAGDHSIVTLARTTQ